MGYFLLPIYQNSLLNSTEKVGLGTGLSQSLAKFGDTYNQITHKICPNVTIKGKTIKPFYKMKVKGDILKTETQGSF